MLHLIQGEQKLKNMKQEETLKMDSLKEEQLEILLEMQRKGFNVCNCGNCGGTILIDNNKRFQFSETESGEEFVCHNCRQTMQYSDCPDFLYIGSPDLYLSEVIEYFKVSGYWIDDNSTFEEYIVTSYENASKLDGRFEDDEIFFFGMTEEVLKEALYMGASFEEDFVITYYEKV